MSILYKYYSHLDENYFKDPNLKIAPVKSLNDPFEAKVSMEYFKNFQIDNSLSDEVEKFYCSIDSMTGIISLSENSHNLLMWSHYANSHKGLCIGYEHDSLYKNQIFNNIKVDMSFLEYSPEPKKVRYSSTRHNHYESTLILNKSTTEELTAIHTSSLLTKGIDWIYEQESRIILPCDTANRMLIKNSDELKNNNISSKIIRKYVDKGVFEKHKDHTNDYYSIDAFQLHSLELEHLFFDENIVLSRSIAPSSIKCIYIGARMDANKAKDLSIKIKSLDGFSENTKIYKLKESKDRFELEIDIEF